MERSRVETRKRDESDPMAEDEEAWSRQDVWLGLGLLTAGILVTALAVLATKNGFSARFLVTGFLVGTLLIFLGGNAVFQSLRS